MRKRKNCGFPNSIEVLWRGGKREFFTSFLSREDAYRLIMVAWHQNRWRPMQPPGSCAGNRSVFMRVSQTAPRGCACWTCMT